MFITGMTNLNWPDLEPRPPTPAPTPVPAQVTPSGEKDKGGNDVTGAALFFGPAAFFLLSALLGSWHNTLRAVSLSVEHAISHSFF